MVILSDQHRGVLENIFSSFTEERLPFLVLRNYEELPIKMGTDCSIVPVTQPDIPFPLPALDERHSSSEHFYHSSFSWAGLHYVPDEEIIASRRASLLCITSD